VEAAVFSRDLDDQPEIRLDQLLGQRAVVGAHVLARDLLLQLAGHRLAPPQVTDVTREERG